MKKVYTVLTFLILILLISCQSVSNIQNTSLQADEFEIDTTNNIIKLRNFYDGSHYTIIRNKTNQNLKLREIEASQFDKSKYIIKNEYDIKPEEGIDIHEFVGFFNQNPFILFEILNGKINYTISKTNTIGRTEINIVSVDDSVPVTLLDKKIEFTDFSFYYGRSLNYNVDEIYYVNCYVKYSPEEHQLILTDNKDWPISYINGGLNGELVPVENIGEPNIITLNSNVFDDFLKNNQTLISNYNYTQNQNTVIFKHTKNNLEVVDIEGLRTEEQLAAQQKHLDKLQIYDYYNGNYYDKLSNEKESSFEELTAFHSCIESNRPFDFDFNTYYFVDGGDIIQYLHEGLCLYDLPDSYNNNSLILLEYDKSKKSLVTVGIDSFVCKYIGTYTYETANNSMNTIPKFTVIYPVDKRDKNSY